MLATNIIARLSILAKFQNKPDKIRALLLDNSYKWSEDVTHVRSSNSFFRKSISTGNVFRYFQVMIYCLLIVQATLED